MPSNILRLVSQKTTNGIELVLHVCKLSIKFSGCDTDGAVHDNNVVSK